MPWTVTIKSRDGSHLVYAGCHMKDCFAVYTIADSKLLADALRSGGSGVLNEGRPWRKIQQWLMDAPDCKLPLLLGDAVVVDGVEWVAIVEQVEIDDAGRTICRFKGLQKLHRRLPLSRLRKASDGEPLSTGYIRPYVPCLISNKTADALWEILEQGHDAELPLSSVTDPVRHYVQYHNSDIQGSHPRSSGTGFSIFTRKNIRNLVGDRVWLISGRGQRRKQFFLEYTFTASAVEDGHPRTVTGDDGIVFDPPLLLSGLPWFEEFKKQQQNFSLGLREIDQATVVELVKLSKSFYRQKSSRDINFVDSLTVYDYRRAVRDLEKKFTQSQIEMLVGHANSSNSAISMQNLSKLAGYGGVLASNLQYGKLARFFVEYFWVEGLDNHIQIFARGDDNNDSENNFQWILRSPFVEALRKEWPDLILEENISLSNHDSVDCDDSEVRPTQRAALIKARLGQGEYRRRLMDLWQGRCALTGCDIPEALIASHAKPWRLCNNEERLDPYNGLLLAAHVDALFDQGLISFDDSGVLLLSDRVSFQQLSLLGINRELRLRFLKEKHRRYLSDHRKLVFKKNDLLFDGATARMIAPG